MVKILVTHNHVRIETLKTSGDITFFIGFNNHTYRPHMLRILLYGYSNPIYMISTYQGKSNLGDQAY